MTSDERRAPADRAPSSYRIEVHDKKTTEGASQISRTQIIEIHRDVAPAGAMSKRPVTALLSWGDNGRRCGHLKAARVWRPSGLLARDPGCVARGQLEVRRTAENPTGDSYRCQTEDGVVWPVAMTVGNLTAVGCGDCHGRAVDRGAA